MKKILMTLTLVSALLTAGCQQPFSDSRTLSGSEPPPVQVETDSGLHDADLGTYCWSQKNGSGMCVDAAGAIDSLAGQPPIHVVPGETVRLLMDYEPKPTNLTLRQTTPDRRESKVALDGLEFKTPDAPGLYYYDFSAWWMDEDEEDVSNGDAHYSFLIQVQ
ncbi:hypothetical protein [Sporosarcina koreensis]|uniref:hypothetical protein n=1 Tax=Sporosarcina koreensis TaxID=334735 RepID=UPI000694C668|nr:hypothetical protein [Sporosarcina koreensis]